MEKHKIIQLRDFYKNYLLDNSIPFWLNNSIDHEYGGYLTCLDREGKIYNTDKSVWFQARGTWIFSRLYNTIEKRKEWLDAAATGYEFLTRYCFDKDGRMFFQVTRDGRPLQKRRYAFSEMFTIMACAEYYQATGNAEAYGKAMDVYNIVLDIYRNPSVVSPKIDPEIRPMKGHSFYMMLLCVTQAVREIDNNPLYNEIIGDLIKILFKDFVKPDKKALFETVGPYGELIDNPQGRCINPGHSIETSWFLMHEGIYRSDKELIKRALEILDWSLELGWDTEYGGLFYFIDIEGKPAEQLEWDMKLWWPHTEALYALLLAVYLTGDVKYETWYQKVHEWSFNHFEDKVYGDWFGYLHRDGNVSSTLKGSMWKGPFHFPRALLFSNVLLDKMASGDRFMKGGIL